jgi:hypothetical protein
MHGPLYVKKKKQTKKCCSFVTEIFLVLFLELIGKKFTCDYELCVVNNKQHCEMQFTAGSLENLTDTLRINSRAITAEPVVNPSNLIVTEVNFITGLTISYHSFLRQR